MPSKDQLREQHFPATSDELLAQVYEELRTLAEHRMRREAPGATLQPTALVHEAYVRLAASDARWDNKGHFFAAAAEAMRRILVDRARRRASARHGGGRSRVDAELDRVESGHPTPGQVLPGASDDQILAVEDALHRMEGRDARMAEVVKLRFFAGLSIEETALALGVSARTVRREWTFAKAWLATELGGDQEWTRLGSE